VQKRVLRTKPNVNYEAGDRTGRLPEVLDLDYARFVEAFAQGSAVPPPAQPSASQPAAASAPKTHPNPPAKAAASR